MEKGKRALVTRELALSVEEEPAEEGAVEEEEGSIDFRPHSPLILLLRRPPPPVDRMEIPSQMRVSSRFV